MAKKFLIFPYNFDILIYPYQGGCSYVISDISHIKLSRYYQLHQTITFHWKCHFFVQEISLVHFFRVLEHVERRAMAYLNKQKILLYSDNYYFFRRWPPSKVSVGGRFRDKNFFVQSRTSFTDWPGIISP